jgi:ubiquinone biosynthesis protein UbiJ
VLTGTLGNLLNRGLPRSPRAQALCAQLSGKSLAIELRDITALRITSDGLTLAVAQGAEPADACIAGGPLGLLSLGGAGGPAALRRGDVLISGDAEVARQFQELLGLLRPDFEEELSLVTGDVVAHQLARLVRAGTGFGRRAAHTTLDNLADFLGHERRDLVPRHEGEQFLRGVDALREDVDRLQARLELVAQQRGTR